MIEEDNWICYYRHKHNHCNMHPGLVEEIKKKGYVQISGFTYGELRKDGTILLVEKDTKQHSRMEYWSFWRRKNGRTIQQKVQQMRIV